VVISARVPSRKQAENLERQVQRLLDYCEACGYQVARSMKEIASELNDNRPKFLGLLRDASISTIVVEHKDRATWFGFRNLETLMIVRGYCPRVPLRTFPVLSLRTGVLADSLAMDLESAPLAGLSAPYHPDAHNRVCCCS
jgi:hypothetical protein